MTKPPRIAIEAHLGSEADVLLAIHKASMTSPDSFIKVQARLGKEMLNLSAKFAADELSRDTKAEHIRHAAIVGAVNFVTATIMKIYKEDIFLDDNAMQKLRLVWNAVIDDNLTALAQMLKDQYK